MSEAPAAELPREKRRAKVKLRGGTVDQAIHHLGNFLTIITTMSKAAVAKAESQEEADRAAKQFFKLFVEVSSTMAALDEAVNPGGSDDMRDQLAELKGSDEYKAMLVEAEAIKRAPLYEFGEGAPAKSKLHPQEACFEVALTADCAGFGGWLIQKTCIINGKTWAVLAVETERPHKPPFKKGEPIRLVVRSVAVDGTVAAQPGANAWQRLMNRAFGAKALKGSPPPPSSPESKS